jgi:hypothetical protein
MVFWHAKMGTEILAGILRTTSKENCKCKNNSMANGLLGQHGKVPPVHSSFLEESPLFSFQHNMVR